MLKTFSQNQLHLYNQDIAWTVGDGINCIHKFYFSFLVLSTKKLLILTYIKKEKDKDKEIEKVKEYYDLSLYFSVINACYENQIISELLYEFKLNIFDIEKKQSNLSNIEIENMRNTFNKLEKDPEIALKYFKNEGEKVKPKAHLFFIIICFRLAFDSQNLLGSLNIFLLS